MSWKIKTIFYTRKYLNNGEYEHNVHCEGEIFGKNIWINEANKLPETENIILNFNYLHNETYKPISKGLVNTHFRYFVHKTGEEPKLSKTKIFAKLNIWKRFKLKVIMEETGWHRNPIEFSILTIMCISFCMTTMFSYFNWKHSNTEHPEKMIQELRELKEIIQSKEINIHNQIIISDSLLKKDTTITEEKNNFCITRNSKRPLFKSNHPANPSAKMSADS